VVLRVVAAGILYSETGLLSASEEIVLAAILIIIVVFVVVAGSSALQVLERAEAALGLLLSA
jgi:hypothetical protein